MMDALISIKSGCRLLLAVRLWKMCPSSHRQESQVCSENESDVFPRDHNVFNHIALEKHLCSLFGASFRLAFGRFAPSLY